MSADFQPGDRVVHRRPVPVLLGLLRVEMDAIWGVVYRRPSGRLRVRVVARHANLDWPMDATLPIGFGWSRVGSRA